VARSILEGAKSPPKPADPARGTFHAGRQRLEYRQPRAVAPGEAGNGRGPNRAKMQGTGMNFTGTSRLVAILAGALALASCQTTEGFNPFAKPADKANGAAASAKAGADRSTTIVERDVEAPEVFQKAEAGLWDGRPSLGGVWVAYPDVNTPERVIIRNLDNGKFVIGALFRRERDNPGPPFQVSSDAANALGILAGAPAQLSVTALRREQVPVKPDASEPAVDTLTPEAGTTGDGATGAIAETSLDPVAQIAASAINKATAQANAGAPDVAAATTAPPVRPQQASTLARPFIQIGIFSVEANANKTADVMRKAGMIPLIKRSELNGKEYWRVLVGPATNAAERATLLEKVRGLGFTDAYAVKN